MLKCDFNKVAKHLWRAASDFSKKKMMTLEKLTSKLHKYK